VETLLVCNSTLGVDADDAADNRADAIGSDDEIVGCRDSVLKSDSVRLQIDGFALQG
jgi:hypothetical protein